MKRPGQLRIKPAESDDSLLVGWRGLRTKLAPESFAEEVRQAMLRDLRKATPRSSWAPSSVWRSCWACGCTGDCASSRRHRFASSPAPFRSDPALTGLLEVIVLNIGCSARPPPRCPTGQGRSVRAATSGTHPLGQAWDTPPNSAA